MRTNQVDNKPLKQQEKIIFIVGNSRSGTTLMGIILGLNSVVFTFEELHFFEQLWSLEERNKFLSQQQAEILAARLFAIQKDGIFEAKNPQEFAEEAERLVQVINKDDITGADVFEAFLQNKTKQEGKSIPCEQTPRNVLYVEEILELYPNSLIINMIRDPRDVLLSQKYKWKVRFLGATNHPYTEVARSWANYHPIVISKLWNASVNAGAKFANHPQVKTVKFEDLITKPEQIVTEVCDFVGIEYTPEMLNVSQSQGGVSSHKKIAQEKKGIDSKATEKWKTGGLSPTEIFLCEQITQANMKKYSYTLFAPKIKPVSLVLAWLALPAKLSLALLLNLNRMRNLGEAIKRRL